MSVCVLDVFEISELEELFWHQIDMSDMKKCRTVLKKCLVHSVALFSPLKIGVSYWEGTG